MSRISLIQLRRGTAFEWENSNPVLASGEPGLDLTNNYLKVGNGISNWNSLSAIGMELDSGVYYNYTNISSNYNVSITDHLIFIDTSSGAVEIQLPTASGVGGKEYIVKSVGGNNNITITTSVEGETIDGEDSFVIHFNNESITLTSNNTNWFII